MFRRSELIYRITNIITIQKPPNLRIVITAGYIVESNLNIVVVTTVSVWVYCGDRYIRAVGDDSALTPCIVGVACNGVGIFIGNSNYVAL